MCPTTVSRRPFRVWAGNTSEGAKRSNLLLAAALVVSVASSLVGVPRARAHIIPPENLHPVAEAYRRATFVLNLNPVHWEQVRADAAAMAKHWQSFDRAAAEAWLAEVDEIIRQAGDEAEPLPRREAAEDAFELLTRAVTTMVQHHLDAAKEKLDDRTEALDQIKQAQGAWASFEIAVQATDVEGFRRLGQAWLGMASALGNPGLLGQGAVLANAEAFQRHAQEVLAYTENNFGEGFSVPNGRRLAAWPINSATFDASTTVPIRLPPGSEVNKQIPRPRQILNMASRGVDESETTLIALGDMAFDSAYVFGEPMRSLGMSCNTCHNKSITNPNFFIPGLSARAGGMDVSNGFFAPHANNGHFDPLDIPDLRGIRFTAPYGRNGRFASLREFVRNVIVNEFNGPEPDPMLLDGMIAYMNEFDFLTNPAINPDGTLGASASEAAKRGEEIFNKPFAQMGGRSCATCHIPSSHFLDHQRHDIGTVNGYEPDSLDRHLDTPTLLSAAYTAPYFHDGSQPTLGAVNEWFNKKFQLGLSEAELDDLTAYVETVGEGVEAYEDTIYYLDAELEEFSFFLSAFEFLDERNKLELMNTTFETIALELHNHKWELQDGSVRPVMERLAEIMDEAYAANQAGDREGVRAKVKEYRALYAANVDVLK